MRSGRVWDYEFNPEGVYKLGHDSVWARDDRFEDTTPATLASSSVLKLFEQWNWGFTMDDADQKNVIPELNRFAVYGATIESLQEGFRVSDGTNSQTAKQEIKKRKRKTRTAATKKQLKAITLVDFRDMTFQQVADEMDLKSRQAAQQLYERGMKATYESGNTGSNYREKPKTARDNDMKLIQYDDEEEED